MLRLEALDERYSEKKDPDWNVFKTLLRCLVKVHETEDARHLMIPKVKKVKAVSKS